MTSRRLPMRGLGAALLLAGCAGGMKGAEVTPIDIPALEAERAERPTDVQLITRLGIGYYDAQDYDKAVDVLHAVLALDDKVYRATVYLGLAFEELGQLDSARAQLNAAGALATGPRQREELAAHLQLLTRRELRASTQAAIQQEATLSRTPPEANTIAVFPFRYLGSNDDLRPLERGVSQLLVTDLGKVSSLRLLERERMQSLVDELQLGSESRVDPATGARSGRLLRAEQVVQGTLQEPPGTQDMQLDANVVSTTTTEVTATGGASDRLQRLFDAEKQVVFQLLQHMGISLSPAEERALSERPTADLQAFLAFSRGLEAEDRGDFEGAAAAYGEAARRDPNFSQARSRRQQMMQLSSAIQTTAAELALGGGGQGGTTAAGGTRGLLQSTLDAITPSVGGNLDSQLSSLPPSLRPSVPEVLGQDDPRITGLFGSVIIIITRP
jgi:tetratricopeptide (TPR) repeat protein